LTGGKTSAINKASCIKRRQVTERTFVKNEVIPLATTRLEEGMKRMTERIKVAAFNTALYGVVACGAIAFVGFIFVTDAMDPEVRKRWRRQLLNRS
jgi:hypothetical protein